MRARALWCCGCVRVRVPTTTLLPSSWLVVGARVRERGERRQGEREREPKAGGEGEAGGKERVKEGRGGTTLRTWSLPLHRSHTVGASLPQKPRRSTLAV